MQRFLLIFLGIVAAPAGITVAVSLHQPPMRLMPAPAVFLDETTNFVNHSMGGILLRACVVRHSENLGRTVMLGLRAGDAYLHDEQSRGESQVLHFREHGEFDHNLTLRRLFQRAFRQ